MRILTTAYVLLQMQLQIIKCKLQSFSTLYGLSDRKLRLLLSQDTVPDYCGKLVALYALSTVTL